MSEGTSALLWIAAAVFLVATVAAAIVLVVKLVRTRRLLADAGLPRSKKLLFWGAIVYLVCPVDLMPDPVLIDDIGVLLLALRSLNKAVPEGARRRAGRRDHRK
ncbi:YkvA family protein [Kitasatospora phosalacinea]|uniref:YkvA family protein n=1 Tax=Kitasatospora phosalacinea TaxID=2065 RepID=UPI0035DCDE24